MVLDKLDGQDEGGFGPARSLKALSLPFRLSALATVKLVTLVLLLFEPWLIADKVCVVLGQ